MRAPHRRSRLISIAALALVGLVAACTPAAPGPIAPSAVPKAASQAGEPVRIGISAALTGPNAAVYAAAYEAVDVYFRRVNDQGGINGRKLELLVEDDSGDATKASANATRLIQQQKVPLLLVASVSATYGPVMSIARAAGTPLLIAGACPKEALPPADPLVFCATSYGTTYDSAAAIRFIKEVATEDVKLGLIGMDTPLSRAYMDSAEEYASQNGMQAVTKQIMPLTTIHFTPYATQVAQSGANWAFAGAPWGAEIGPFEALQKIGWTGNYLLWAHQPAEEELRRRKSDTLYGLAGNTLFVEDLPIHQEIRATAERYKTTYPVEQLAEGWVVAMVLDEVIKSAGTGGPSEIQAALNRLDLDTQGLRGGRLTFTPENHYRSTVSYKLYRWDTQRNTIVAVRDWTSFDVVPR